MALYTIISKLENFTAGHSCNFEGNISLHWLFREKFKALSICVSSRETFKYKFSSQKRCYLHSANSYENEKFSNHLKSPVEDSTNHRLQN